MKLVAFSFVLLISIVKADDPCPNGYTQAPNGGYCYKLKSYYDTFMQLYIPKTYDQVAKDCNSDGGGTLASVHNDEENTMIQNLVFASPDCSESINTMCTNIGLRCTGTVCKWDDGSPVTFTNFEKGQAPIDDGLTRCYGIFTCSTTCEDVTWSMKNCTSQQKSDCWACSVKPKLPTTTETITTQPPTTTTNMDTKPTTPCDGTPGRWSKWSEWSPCIRPNKCGYCGQSVRTRSCIHGCSCDGAAIETQGCGYNNEPCRFKETANLFCCTPAVLIPGTQSCTKLN